SQWVDQSVELELVNASGQVMQVQRTVAPASPLRLDVAGYPTGLYFLRVKTGSGVGETVRFVIE
ncbi:MAG: T9SS type A sorting domain-containing protein, partial [Saprospiraceae bacterium]